MKKTGYAGKIGHQGSQTVKGPFGGKSGAKGGKVVKGGDLRTGKTGK